MSKKSIINISALAVGLVLAGCSVLPEETLPDKGREIKFTASVGTFKVKATDTAFEIGDQIGLFADSPVNAENVRMTWDGTNLVPETSLFWAPGDEREVRFSAYYPYSPDRERYGQFFVNADQSTHELFTQSDFMVASSSVFSTDGVVDLEFFHCFSRIVLHLDNQLQDLSIADVFVGDVRGRVEGDVWGYYNVTGSSGTIKAGKAVTSEGESVWALIIPAQNCRPQLMITTTDGKQFTYESEDNQWFERGYSYNAYVTLDGSSIFTDFTAQVTDWTENNDLAFPMPGTQSWSVTGTSAGELPLVNCFPGEDVYYAIIYYEAGQELSFIKNGSTVYGYSADGSGSFVADGERIVLPATGVYDIMLYPEDNYIEIGHMYDFQSWGITGTIEEMDWNMDHYADFTTVSYVDDVPYPVLGYRIKYREGEQFKFRFWGQWNMEFGYPELWWDDYYSVTVPTDEFVPLMHQGSNIALPGDGLYEIYLDVWNERMLAVKTGDLPPDPVYCNSVADAVYVQDNTPVKIENALVYAVTTRGFIIWDGPGSGNPALFVYHGYVSEPVVSVGVRVNVRGTKVTYRGVPEITNTDLSFEIVTHGESLPQIYYEELTAQLDNYPAYSIPGSYRGVLSGRTVACEGSSNLGELYWPFQDLSALEGATVRATGFTFYSYNGLSDLVADHIRVLDLPVESTITDVYNGNDGDYFKVTGTVTKLSSTRYGNYYLKDDDGNELSIYGTVSEWGYYPLDGVNWDGVTLAQAGVSVGSRVTVVGPRVTDGVVKLWDVILVDAVPGEPPYEPSQDPNYDQYYDWNFSSSEWVDAFNRYFPDGPSTNHYSIHFKVNGLLVDGGGQAMRYNYSDDRYFIQPNGPGSEYARYFSFEAPTPGKLYVWVSNTSASENLSRLVVVNQNGAISEQPGGYATTGGPVMLEFDVTGGNVKIYPTVGALRFYRICFVGDGSEPVTPPDAGHESYVWDFSSERWQYELAQLGAVNTDILDWDITVDGLQFYSSAKSKYNTTFIQTGGRGSLTDRFFKFTAPKNGVLSVYVTNTGNSEALDREVAVYTSDDCTAFLPGGYPSSGGPVQVVFEGIPAGEVKIYPSVNGLRFYKIQFDY